MPLKTSSVLFFQKSCYFFAEKYRSVKEGFACDGHALLLWNSREFIAGGLCPP